MDHNTDSIRYMLNQLRSMQYPGDKMSGSWEGKVQPLVLILLQKLGGRVEITEEDMLKYVNSTYVLRTWYDNQRMVNMYELVQAPTTIDGEVVDDVATEGNGQRAIGTGESGPRRNDRLG